MVTTPTKGTRQSSPRRPTSSQSRKSDNGKIKDGKRGGKQSAELDETMLCWVYLKEDQIKELNALGQNKEDVINKLTSYLQLSSNPLYDLQSSIYLAYHSQNFMFAQQKSYSAIQTSTFFGIMKYLLESAVQDKLGVKESLALFKDVLLRHSSAKTEGGMGNGEVFGPKEVREITEWVVTGCLQHYRLLTYCCSSTNSSAATQTITRAVGVEVSPSTLWEPLNNSMPLEEWTAEQYRMRLDQEKEQARIEAEEEEKKRANANPLSMFTREQIQHLSTEVVSSMVGGIIGDFERNLDELTKKVLAKTEK